MYRVRIGEPGIFSKAEEREEERERSVVVRASDVRGEVRGGAVRGVAIGEAIFVVKRGGERGERGG